MNCNYFFRILKPGEKISIIIDQYQLDEKILYASQDGKRVNFNTKELIKSYLKHPLMTFKIISAIHYEAFKLWTKGIKIIQESLKLKIILHLKTDEYKNLSDKIVFNILKNIQFGYLELVNHDGEVYKFGDPKDTLKANIKIKNSNFTFNLIKVGV